MSWHLLFSLLLLSKTAHADHPSILSSSAHLAANYDFVICGAGPAGLVVAARLTEDANTTVLVLEAGGTGDDSAASINIPSNTYYNSLTNSEYDWSYSTDPQPQLGGAQKTWPRGKVLGGSTALNGMYLVRPSTAEVNAWSSLIAPDDQPAPPASNTTAYYAPASAAWSWSNIYAAMNKAETFTPPSTNIKNQANIQYNAGSHGQYGQLRASYPGYTLPLVSAWGKALSKIGVAPAQDPYSGKTLGSFVATSSINSHNWTRSYARSAYLDALPPRPNLDVLPNALCTKIKFGSNSSAGVVATGVSYTADNGPTFITANKEVLVAGGAVGSPQLLMLSGVGPADVLQYANVKPLAGVSGEGVGHHLQDHLSAQVVFKSGGKDTFALELKSRGPDQTVPSSFLSFINSATAYVGLSSLFGSPTDFLNGVNPTPSKYPSTDTTVLDGYALGFNTTKELLAGGAGAVELLLGLTGTALGGDGSVAIQAALQHPFSQGQIFISSNLATDPPHINPTYLSHPADLAMLRQGLKMARSIGQALGLGDEVDPGDDVQSDGDWEDWLKGVAGTEYHPSCTCAMLPQDQGGVVDGELKVYGLANVRVIDSSVFPIEFAAHLQAPTYGLAEQAATIIRAQYNGVPVPWATTIPPAGSNQGGGSNGGHSGALSLTMNKSLGGFVLAFALLYPCL